MKKKMVPWLLVLADVLALMVAFRLGFEIASLFSEYVLGLQFMHFFALSKRFWLWFYSLQSVCLIGLFATHGHYRLRVPWWEQIRYLVTACAAMMLLAGFVLYTFKLPFSRMWVLCSWMTAIPLIITGRLLVRYIAKLMKEWGTRVLLFGGPENVLETIYALTADSYSSYRVRKIWLVGATAPIDPAALPARLRRVEQVLIRDNEIPEVLGTALKTARDSLVILAPDEKTKMDLPQLLRLGQLAGVDVAFVNPMRGLSFYGMQVQHFFGSHTVLLKPKRRVASPLNRFLKRALDVVGASGGLLVAAVPILILTVLVRRDGGPAFFSQPRVGRDGKLFRCWKFRSMVPNAAEVLESLLKENSPRGEAARAEWAADFKLRNDPRITRIGRFIRKSSLDELPQLWNVLKGDMSLVGPRPVVEKELASYGKHTEEYITVKPGLTGLWQVSGRNDTSYAYRVYLDSWYVAHWSLWTDVVIIIQTVGILLSRSGAY